MRPVRFVALSEDGQALVLADEVGRLLALPIDDRVATALHGDAGAGAAVIVAPASGDPAPSRCPRATSRPASAPASPPTTSPASPACRSTGCCATPARCCRSGRCSPSTPAAPGCAPPTKGATLAEVVDARLGQHGIDTEKISWDAYRRDDGTWRIIATWPSRQGDRAGDLGARQGPPGRHAARRHGAIPVRRAARAAARPGAGAPERAASGTRCPRRRGASRARGGHGLPARPPPTSAPARPATRSAPAATRLLASLDRPSAARSPPRPRPRRPPRPRSVAAARPRCSARRSGSAFDDDPDRPRRSRPCRRWRCCGRAAPPAPPATEQPATASKPRKRLPSWDDVLFGTAPAQRETS